MCPTSPASPSPSSPDSPVASATLSRRPGSPPQLLHPPRADTWWRVNQRWIAHDGRALWIHDADASRCAALEGPISVRRGRVIAPHGTLDPDSGRWTPRSRDDGLRWDRGWHSDDAAVPAAFRDAHRPMRFDGGAVWIDAGHVWRWDGQLRAIGDAPRSARLSVSEVGSACFGARSFTHAALPGRSAEAIPISFDADGWGVRWSGDGEVLFGADANGQGWSWHLRLRALARLPGRPVDATACFSEALPSFAHRIRDAGCAVDGDRLAGPAGLVWDLIDGTPVSTDPVIASGATFALRGRFGTIDGATGVGRWVSREGAVVGDFQIPLHAEEEIDRAHTIPDAALVLTTDDRLFRVDADTVEAIDALIPKKPRPIELSLTPEVSIRVDATAQIGDHRYGWRSDGLLVRLANPVVAG
jgi:hypothetical protein